MKKYIDYIIKSAEKLLNINSPSGYTKEVVEFLFKEFEEIGYDPQITVKGGLIVNIGGNNDNDAVFLEAHVDTLGAMVAEIKSNGRLRVTNIGGMNANNAEAENCIINTRFNGNYEGTCQLVNPSIHVNGNYNSTERTFDTVEIVLDELVSCAEDVLALGIDTGDFVCFEPRFRVTNKGFIKSRFLDDKLSAAILLGFAKYVKDKNIKLPRTVYEHFTVFEEVGHGGCASVPDGVTEAISIDMGCVGDGLKCTEREVSICAKDSGGPYHYDVVTGLVKAAKDNDIKYKLDIYPHYGSDVEATLRAGYDIKHGLIGPGVFASHGYERSHIDGVENTLKLLISYLK